MKLEFIKERPGINDGQLVRIYRLVDETVGELRTIALSRLPNGNYWLAGDVAACWVSEANDYALNDLNFIEGLGGIMSFEEAEKQIEALTPAEVNDLKTTEDIERELGLTA